MLSDEQAAELRAKLEAVPKAPFPIPLSERWEHDPVEYAIMVIESYQMDLRNSEHILSPHNIGYLLQGKSLADIGFCQGTIYTGAIDHIRKLATKQQGESKE